MITFSALLAICAGNSLVTGEFPAQRPVTRSFDVFFDLRLNKRLSRQSWGWCLETLSRQLWRHRNVASICHKQPAPLPHDCSKLQDDLLSSYSLTPDMLNCYSDFKICIPIKCHFLYSIQQKKIKFTIEQLYILPIIDCQYHACWCHGDLRSQGISRHGIDQIRRTLPSLAPQGLMQHSSS